LEIQKTGGRTKKRKRKVGSARQQPKEDYLKPEEQESHAVGRRTEAIRQIQSDHQQRRTKRTELQENECHGEQGRQGHPGVLTIDFIDR